MIMNLLFRSGKMNLLIKNNKETYPHFLDQIVRNIFFLYKNTHAATLGLRIKF